MTDVSLLTSGHDVADARLHRQTAALLRAGLRVELLGLGDPAGAPPGLTRLRTWPRPHLAGRATLAGRMAAAASGRVLFTLDPDSALAGYAVTRGRGVARRAPAPTGRRSAPARRTPAPVRRLVVDVHEDYARLLADRAWARRAGGAPGVIARVLVSAFTTVAARADLTVVADHHVPPARARHRLVVPNLPDPAMLPPPGPADPTPRALYVGDLRESRGLFDMLDAVAAAPGWLLDLVGPVAPADQDRVTQRLAADPDLASRVHLAGRQPPAAAFARVRGAWVGLLLLADTPAFRDALPSKLHEYLACGLPVITTDLPRSAALVRDSGAGVVVPSRSVVDSATGAHSAAEVAAVLRSWSADPAALDELRRAATEYAHRVREQPNPYDELARAVAELARIDDPPGG